MQVRPDAPADGGEGFKRTWSEAKEEVFLQNISIGVKQDIFYFVNTVNNRQDGQKMGKAMENALG